jgi:ABC-type methionine transport system ATPase subunit
VLEVLRLDGVCKAFDRGRDRISVLEDVSLSVGAGEIVSVVGTRAQGKSTLIRL